MKLAIIGSRSFNNKMTIDVILGPHVDTIEKVISGGAKGADKLGEEWARDNGIETEIFLPDWDTHGKSAGYLRNVQIVENSTHVLAFWDGKSKGTKHSIDLANKMGKKLKIVTF